MAPQLINRKTKSETKLDTAKYQKIKKTMKNYQKFIRENFQYVGGNFAHEARSIHYDPKKKNKAIYGKASRKEIEDLNQEGIKTEEFPWIEDKEN